METPFPLRDLILYRIYMDKEILELEFFDNFRKDLSFLIENGFIEPCEPHAAGESCPYRYLITEVGKRYLSR
ncbi:hypothetical protein [Sphingobacterium sp.]|uniref:hypothetical protein n=1 Tax=Sphingobacterium sp. TaxID=341027 RepID=UPI0028ABF41E|nr:hypothetical protein [Sphingobacterium sp.]